MKSEMNEYRDNLSHGLPENSCRWLDFPAILCGMTSMSRPCGALPRCQIAPCARAVFEILEMRMHFAVGSIDPTFAFDGVFKEQSNWILRVQSLVLPEGQILLAATVSGAQGSQNLAIMRLQADGAKDSTFGNGGVETMDLGYSQEELVDWTLLPSGKILGAANVSTGIAGSQRGVLLRLNSDCTPDASFGTNGQMVTSGGGGTLQVSDLAVDSQSRIYLSGKGGSGGGTTEARLVRYTASGQLDTTFNGTGYKAYGWASGAEATAVAVDSQGHPSIIYRVDDLASLPRITRHLQTGSTDTSFGINGTVTLPIAVKGLPRRLIVDTADRLVFSTVDYNVYQYSTLGRLTSVGALDTSFGAGGSIRLFKNVAAIRLRGETIDILSNDFLGTQSLAYYSRINSNAQLDAEVGNMGLAKLRFDASLKYNEAYGIQAVDSRRMLVVGRAYERFSFISAARVFLDATPTLTAVAYNPDLDAINLSIDENVASSIDVADLTIRDLSTQEPTTANVDVEVVADGHSTAVSLRCTPRLSDGLYRLEISAAGVFNASGLTLPRDETLSFHILAADANQDRFVDTNDFNILAANFGGSNKVFSQGNFNYDASGLVDSQDFDLFIAQYGKRLAAPAPAVAMQGSTLFASGVAGDSEEESLV
jgi:uncharacterized delta-60 repeat protein